MSGYLYRFEARGIQSYILGHRKLKRLLGASAIVRELVEVELPKVLIEIDKAHGEKCECLMSAAGMAMIRFPKKARLAAFLRVWPYFVSAYAPGLRTVQAWVSMDCDDPHKALRATLDRARCTPPVDLPAGNPVMDRSPFRKLPALPKPDADGALIDPAAARAIAVQKDQKRHGTLVKTIYAGHKQDETAADFPDDLNEMTGGHYIAVIHADGNGVGKWFREQGVPFEDLKRRSDALKDTSYAALRAAIKTLFVKGDEHLHGVPILFGGDDLVMIVRADKAIGFLKTYAAVFEEGFKSEERPADSPICLSAGVAFVRPNHAFHLANALAARLGKRAKAVSRKYSSVWFHRFTDVLADDPPRHACPLPLTSADPKSDPLKGVEDAAKQLHARRIARGPIRQMLLAIEDGNTAEAQQRWDRFSTVHARRAASEFGQLKTALEAVSSGLSTTPTTEASDGLKSPWVDINTLAVVQEASMEPMIDRKGGRRE